MLTLLHLDSFDQNFFLLKVSTCNFQLFCKKSHLFAHRLTWDFTQLWTPILDLHHIYIHLCRWQSISAALFHKSHLVIFQLPLQFLNQLGSFFHVYLGWNWTDFVHVDSSFDVFCLLAEMQSVDGFLEIRKSLSDCADDCSTTVSA